jgi:two-component system NtrC family sensor kinase
MVKEIERKEAPERKLRAKAKRSSSPRSQRKLPEREQHIEETLRQSEERYRTLAEQSLMGLVVVQDFRIVYANSAYAEVSGYSVDELLSASPAQLQAMIHPEDQALVWGRFRDRLEGKAALPRYECRAIRKDGTVCWMEVHATRIEYNGKPAIQAAYIDITDYKQAGEALKQSEERYRTILDEMEEGYYEVDIAGNFTFVNDAMSHILGYSRDELIGMNYKTYTPREYVKAVFQAYNHVYRTGEPMKWFPMAEIRKDGTRILAEDSVLPLRNDKGEVVGFRGVSRDVTNRRQAEEALQKSEERYRQLTENAGEAIFVVQDGRVKFMNPKGAELSGYSIEELVSKPFVEFIHPEDIDMVADRYLKRLKGEPVPQIYDFRIIRKDGIIRWGELNAVPISWEDRPAVLCFMNDITERKEAEQALRQSEERYRAILERMQDSYFEADIAGNLTFVNSAACRHLRYSREELIGMNYKNFVAEDYTRSVFQVFNEVYRAGVPNKGFQWKTLRKDGSPGFIDSSVAPLRNDEGEIIGFSGVGRDITERRRMEEQLMLTERLASIGQLAAGIAHELNNPLTAIVGFSDLLLERDLASDVKADLNIVSQEAKRAVAIVKGLLSFAREQRVEKTLVDINSVIQGVLQVRYYEQRVSNIEIDARFAPALPQVMGNGSQLEKVFVNIITNAEQVMLEAHGRGKLTITTEQVGDIIRISITDDGPGISPDNMKRLFTPFFTTREVGKGSGLGLSVSHGIVAEHDGKIYAASELGKGATFVVELPISKEQTEGGA